VAEKQPAASRSRLLVSVSDAVLSATLDPKDGGTHAPRDVAIAVERLVSDAEASHGSLTASRTPFTPTGGTGNDRHPASSCKIRVTLAARIGPQAVELSLHSNKCLHPHRLPTERFEVTFQREVANGTTGRLERLPMMIVRSAWRFLFGDHGRSNSGRVASI